MSGLEITYDTSQPERRRLVSLERDGVAVQDDDRLTVAAPGFLAEGGDLYTVFATAEEIRRVGKVSDVITGYFESHDIVAVPARGRQVDISR